MKRRLLLTLAVLLPLAACDSSDPEDGGGSDGSPLALGTFEASVDVGGDELDLSGEATTVAPSDSLFFFSSILLGDAADRLPTEAEPLARSIYFLRTDDEPFTEGAFSLGRPDFSGTAIIGGYTEVEYLGPSSNPLMRDSTAFRVYTADSGELVIEEVTGDGIAGRFSFSGIGYEETEDGRIPLGSATAEGRFNARFVASSIGR